MMYLSDGFNRHGRVAEAAAGAEAFSGFIPVGHLAADCADPFKDHDQPRHSRRLVIIILCGATLAFTIGGVLLGVSSLSERGFQPRRVTPGLWEGGIASDDLSAHRPITALKSHDASLRHGVQSDRSHESGVTLPARTASLGLPGGAITTETVPPAGANRPYRRIRGRVSSSLYKAAKDRDIPDRIIAQAIHAHSSHVDFRHDIRKGDRFDIFFGPPLIGTSKRATLLYTALSLAGKQQGYYRFTRPDDGTTGYYDGKGRNARRLLSRTPIPGARITSGFGMRKHPILGHMMMHKGVDFGAPRGTPIKATGGGEVEVARRVHGYGNYVRIKHNSRYKTAYAHMSRIAKGIKPGTKVKQGQIIGYVGMSGTATAPHLHYEVLIDDKQVDPVKVKVVGGQRLSGKMLQTFQAHKNRIDAMMRAASLKTWAAQNALEQKSPADSAAIAPKPPSATR